MDWFSVKDRLPEDGEDILVYCNDGAEEFYAPVHYDKEVWFDCLANIELDVCAITHWMPLPEPPEEK